MSLISKRVVKNYVSLKHLPHELQKLLVSEHFVEHSGQTFPTMFVGSETGTTLYACSESLAVQFGLRLHFCGSKYSTIGYENPDDEP